MELIIGVMLAALVIGAAGTFLVLGTGLLNQTIESSQQQVDTTRVAESIAEELRLASSVRLVENEPLPDFATLAEGERLLYIGDADGELANTGYYFLYYPDEDSEPWNYYGTNFYGSYTVSLDYKARVGQDDDKSFTVKVSVYNAEGTLTNTSQASSFRLVNTAAAYEPLQSAEAVSTNTPFYLIFTYYHDEGPDPEPATANGDDSTDRDKEWEVPKTGYYKLECWGANGGQIPTPYISSLSQNGFGGYASGTVYFTKGTIVYLTAGGAGKFLDSTSSAQKWPDPTSSLYAVHGGFNGGGDAAMDPSSATTYRTGGGGASDVRVLNDDLSYRILVAGGGGGNSSHVTTSYGGNGGGLTGANGGQDIDNAFGGGGTQSAGGWTYFKPEEYPPGFGVGGSFHSISVGGGGGGWYGGGGGKGAGGGSGYVLTEDSTKPTGYFGGTNSWSSYCLTDGVNVQKTEAGYVTKPPEASGNGGYVRITFVSP
ncbi:MAG: hypothetical protein LBJ48_03365 [Coriobacteriales bacterium]|nr:hypothetical protein [Coriobacteriales bacterium]